MGVHPVPDIPVDVGEEASSHGEAFLGCHALGGARDVLGVWRGVQLATGEESFIVVPVVLALTRVLHFDDEHGLLLYSVVHESDSSRSFSHLLGRVDEHMVLCDASFAAVGASGVVYGVDGVWAFVDVLVGCACWKSEEDHRVGDGE